MYGYAMYMPALFSHKSGYINISLLFFGLSGILVVFPVIRVFLVNLGTGSVMYRDPKLPPILNDHFLKKKKNYYTSAKWYFLIVANGGKTWWSIFLIVVFLFFSLVCDKEIDIL